MDLLLKYAYFQTISQTISCKIRNLEPVQLNEIASFLIHYIPRSQGTVWGCHSFPSVPPSAWPRRACAQALSSYASYATWRRKRWEAYSIKTVLSHENTEVFMVSFLLRFTVEQRPNLIFLPQQSLGVSKEHLIQFLHCFISITGIPNSAIYHCL